MKTISELKITDKIFVWNKGLERGDYGIIMSINQLSTDNDIYEVTIKFKDRVLSEDYYEDDELEDLELGDLYSLFESEESCLLNRINFYSLMAMEYNKKSQDLTNRLSELTHEDDL